ncbi:hypothetical protein [Thalassobacillus devorans]|uniref:hypothetical protein n=1 Tax=Thalassobacillus devorans TaxID=279813 RepID=UPI000A1CAE46|nr:hypothetical protein [Thalassobacillus devorans]
MSGFWLGVTTALIGAVIGFLGSWLLTLRNERKQEKAVWYAVREELTTNYTLAKGWLQEVCFELETIRGNNSLAVITRNNM